MSEEKEVEDVIAESSPAEDVIAESSPAASEEATSKEATQEADQHVPYDRFKEVNDERNYWRDQYMNSANRQQPAPQQSQQQSESSVDALIANLPAEQRLFMQEWGKAQKAEFAKMLELKEGDYRATIDALASQNAKIQEKLFRQEQVDVKPGSREEIEIANLIRVGVDPDKAAWAIMGAKRVEAAKSTKKVEQVKKIQQKAQANLETSGVPTNSGVPKGERVSYRDDLDRRMKAAGL